MTNWGTKKRSIDDNIDEVAAVDSPILLTQYSSEASQLIKSFTKYMPFVVIILILITSITTFDLVVRQSGFFTNVLTDKTIDTMITAVSILLIIFLIFTVRPVLRSQKILDKWSNLFENNSIRTGILLSINNKSKEEILKALSKNIEEEIASPLQYYLSKSGDGTEFYDINVSDVIFDILIDKSTIKTNINSDSLKNTFQDYGSILIKLTHGTIDKNLTQSVIKSLQNYRKEGNKIGLAMIIGESITNESYYLIDKIKDKAISKSLILIEKPTIHNNPVSTSHLKNLNNILTQ